MIEIFCAGLGATDPQVADGTPSPGSPAAQVKDVGVSIAGQKATVQFAGLVPGLVGLYQINLAVPTATGSGDSLPLVVTAGNQSSAPVGIAVRSE